MLLFELHCTKLFSFFFQCEKRMQLLSYTTKYLYLSHSTRSFLGSFHWWRAMWIDSQEKLLLLHSTSTNNLTSYCWFIDNASSLDTWQCKECAESFQSVRLCHSHRCFCRRCGCPCHSFFNVVPIDRLNFAKIKPWAAHSDPGPILLPKERWNFDSPMVLATGTAVRPCYFEKWMNLTCLVCIICV